MNGIIQLIFVVIVSNAGGEGKTMLAQLLHALWTLAGEPVELLDGDEGNMAAKVADQNARPLGWGVKAIRAPEIFAALKGGHVILDLGANSLASHREIVGLLPALRQLFAEAGYRTVALMPVSTNKLGAVEAIVELEPKIDGFETMFVRVNRDGSNIFDPGLEGRHSVDVGHLRPGFQNFVRGPGGSIARAVSDPPADHGIAAAHVADWMRRFAVQPPIVDLIGDGPMLKLDEVRPERPASLRFQVMTLADTTDRALTENQRRSRILTAIDRCGWTASGLGEVASLISQGRL